MLFPGVEAQEFSAFTIFFMIFSFPSLPHLLPFLFLSFLPYCLLLFLSFATHTYRGKQWHERCFIALAKAVNLPWAWGAKAVYTREQQAHLPGAQHPVGHIGTLERWEGSEAKPPPLKTAKPCLAFLKSILQFTHGWNCLFAVCWHIMTGHRMLAWVIFSRMDFKSFAGDPGENCSQ